MGKLQCCDKEEEVVIIRKGAWSADEDAKLVQCIKQHGHCTWRDLPKQAGLFYESLETCFNFPCKLINNDLDHHRSGLLRCGKSCRLRWVNYLRPNIKRGPFTPEEVNYIIQLQSLLGNKWAAIASHFPGRTDNEIKNVWNTRLKKRLSSMSTNSTIAQSGSAMALSMESSLAVDDARAMEITSQKQGREDDDIYRPNVELMMEASSDSMIMSSNEFPKYSSDTTAALKMLLDFHGGDNNMEFLHDHDYDFLSGPT
ncbi:hypothetical protein Ddye_013690 [Dipteronia dyeriana]|uniref:Uncharacterized protein n=1 Tax=Dipteronia dyeriana TaxID=168575 RepID=A0AAD9X6U7_9ROSI|nr:hypothetical protein Ddye_013690 [Dipteronia dyeriana]